MATSIQKRGTKYQLRITHPLLIRPFFATLPSEEEACASRDGLMALLEKGVVPQVMKVTPLEQDNPLLLSVIRDYEKKAPITKSDQALFGHMTRELRGVRLHDIGAVWADEWVQRLKLQKNLAPGTIRKRVEALARALDWHWRSVTPKGETPPANALRSMPRGYSLYSPADTRHLGEKQRPKTDVARDRRLSPKELAALEAYFRAHPALAEVEMFYRLVVDTGLRMSEAYTLRRDQVDLEGAYLRVDGSKGHRGAAKPRTVPLKKNLRPMLKNLCSVRDGLLFTFWDGTSAGKRRTTNWLSWRFRTVFEKAGIPDMTEHDLRHEACCRWMLLRDKRGWLFTDIEIMKIMGWTSKAMMLRYASLRGEDLSARLG